MHDENEYHDCLMTPIKQQSNPYINNNEEIDQDIIILNDDDFIQATFNLMEQNEFVPNHYEQKYEFKTDTLNNPVDNSDLMIDLIDLTSCEDFDLNDLFLIQETSENSFKNDDQNQQQQLIKNEFDFKFFNLNQNDNIEEIVINDFEEVYQTESCQSNDDTIINDSSNKKVLKCDYCSKTFNKTYNYKRHLQQHTEVKNIHTCPGCDRKILDKSNFSKHLKLCCNSTIIKSNDLNPNKSLKKSNNEYECSICRKVFNKKYNFFRHLKVHSLNNKKNFEHVQSHNSTSEFYQCEKCNRCFVELAQLQTHIKTWHYANITCKYCEMNFDEKFEYIKHLNTFHSFNFKFECKYCKKRFRYFSHYQQHKNIHEKVKTSNLSFQNKSFDESRQVEQEILNEINKNSTFQINQCYVCGKKFSKLFNFKRHIKNSHK